MATEPHESAGCLWGCLPVAIVGLVAIAFGWNVAGALAVFTGFALSLALALRHGAFDWLGHGGRGSHPRSFWLLIAIHAALTLLAGWHFVETISQT